MREFLKLNRPPIVEAIVDWNGMVPDNWILELESIRKHGDLENYFPIYQKKIFQHSNVKFSEADDPKLTNLPKSSAHQFWNERRTRLVQYRQNGFSFNLLPPYTTFEAEISDIRREWERYLTIVPNFILQDIRLRFINRIVVALKDEHLDWSLYFKIGNDSNGIPDEYKLNFKSNQTGWQDSNSNRSLVRTIFLESIFPKEEAKIILDIETFQSNLRSTDRDWETIETILSELRKMKNQAFFGGITDLCLQMFLV